MYMLLGGINGLIVLSDSFISYALFIAMFRTGQQPIEIIGLFVGFIIPMGVACLSLTLNRKLDNVFKPRSPPPLEKKPSAWW